MRFDPHPEPLDRIVAERFLTYFMLPLFGALFLLMLAIGVGVLTGIVETEGSRIWAWVFVAVPVASVLWVRWLGRFRAG